MNSFVNLFSWLDSIESSAKNYWKYCLLSLLILFALILVRYPGFVTEPRIYGEESIYYETFFHNDVLDGFDALVYPSYYSGFSRVAGFLASLVEPESAAAVLTLFGFLVLITPILILFLTDCKYWDSLQKKIVLSLFLILSCSTGEIWLNSNDASFIIVIGTFLILLDDNLASRAKRIFYALYIAFAVFNGPITLIMAPFFAFRYYDTRQKQFFNYCLILFFLGIVHVLYYLVSTNSGIVSPSRFATDRDLIRSFIFLVSTNILFPLIGYFLSILFRVGLDTAYLGLDKSPYLEVIDRIFPEFIGSGIKQVFYILTSMASFLVGICFVALIVIIYREFKKSNLEERVYFLSLFIYLTLVLTVLSFAGLGGFRYAYVTGFILLFYLYQGLMFDKEKVKGVLVRFLLIFSITIGIVEYYPRTISFTSSVLFGESVKWPNWEGEVGLWRKDSSYQPKVWPYIKKTNGIWPERVDIWKVDLNKPRAWQEVGGKKFSEELSKLVSPQKTKPK